MAIGLQELKDKRQALFNESCQLSDKAAEESRELNPEEQGRFDIAVAEIEKQTKEIKRREDLQRIGEELAPKRISEPITPTNTATVHDKNGVEGKHLGGVKHYRHKPLKAFKGPDADEKAYNCGQFLLATIFGRHSAQLWCRDKGINYLAQGESVNTAGGVLVPDQLEMAIIDLREQYGVFRREAKVWPMNSDTLIIPRRTGGLTVYYPGENPSSGITQSEKTWDSVTLIARMWSTLTLMSSEINEDAVINLADDLASEIAYAFSNAEDTNGFNGDGTSTYGGIWGATVKINDGNHAASIFTAATGDDSFPEFTLSDFHGVTGKLPLYARGNAKWYISAAGFASSMERLAYAGGGNTTSNIGGGTGLSFLGYPVVLSQVLNTGLVGTPASGVIACLFGDLRMSSAFGSRRGVTVDKTEHRYFEFNQIGIRGTQRVDINNHSLGDGTNAGPLIALKTP